MNKQGSVVSMVKQSSPKGSFPVRVGAGPQLKVKQTPADAHGATRGW